MWDRNRESRESRMDRLSENIGLGPGKPEIVRKFVTFDRLKHVFQGRYKNILVQNNAKLITIL